MMPLKYNIKLRYIVLNSLALELTHFLLFFLSGAVKLLNKID